MKKFETEVRLSREMSLMDATLIGDRSWSISGLFLSASYESDIFIEVFLFLRIPVSFLSAP
jgi:hypothetical protein